MDLKDDPRFEELPQHLQDQLKNEPITDMMGDDEWHEVQFNIGRYITQAAVVNRKYIVKGLGLGPSSTIERIVRL